MSINCMKCIKNKMTGIDHLCDECREACKCQRCGRLYKMDLIVKNEIWNRISPKAKPAGLLCPVCIIHDLEILYGWSAFKIIEIEKELEAGK